MYDKPLNAYQAFHAVVGSLRHDLREFTGLDKDELDEHLVKGAEFLREKWNDGFKDLDGYYKKADDYIYDSACWMLENEGRQDFLRRVLEMIERFRPRWALDYGCSIASEGLGALLMGCHVRFVDWEHKGYKFAKYRFKRIQAETTFELCPYWHTPGDFDPTTPAELMVAIDVFEHLGENWAEKADKLVQNKKIIMVSAPFRDPSYDDPIHVQHFVEGEKTVGGVMGDNGFLAFDGMTYMHKSMVPPNMPIEQWKQQRGWK